MTVKAARSDATASVERVGSAGKVGEAADEEEDSDDSIEDDPLVVSLELIVGTLKDGKAAIGSKAERVNYEMLNFEILRISTYCLK